MKLLDLFFAALTWVGQRAARACRPLWRAWDWLTGRPSIDLALTLLPVFLALLALWHVARRHWLEVFVMCPFLAWWLAVQMRSVKQAGTGDALPTAIIVLTPMAGFAVMSDMAAAVRVLLGNQWPGGRLAIDALGTLTLLAAIAHTPGSGRSLWARARDAVAAWGLRPAPGAA